VYDHTNDPISQIAHLVRDYDNCDPDGPLFVEALTFARPMGNARRQRLADLLQHAVDAVVRYDYACEAQLIERMLSHLPEDLKPVIAELYKHAIECSDEGCAGWWEANAA
jgi:hypothetical protein